MDKFNKYAFLEELEVTIAETDQEDFWELIYQEIDIECMYYSDCFQIIEACGMTDWKDNEFGVITNIQQLAYVALYDFVIDNLEIPA